jgi:hypothetical protein
MQDLNIILIKILLFKDESDTIYVMLYIINIKYKII